MLLRSPQCPKPFRQEPCYQAAIERVGLPPRPDSES